MQDRFKFRIFSKTVKKFIYLDNAELCIDKENMGLLYRSEHLYLGDYEELQQCTGLKDKNGKLIYEGDIIRIFNECFENRHIVKFGNFAMFDYDFQEDYEKGSTAVYGWYLGGLPLPIPLSISIETSGMQIEVIGNIYENPELLEARDE